jgi:hypothetical protein
MRRTSAPVAASHTRDVPVVAEGDHVERARRGLHAPGRGRSVGVRNRKPDNPPPNLCGSSAVPRESRERAGRRGTDNAREGSRRRNACTGSSPDVRVHRHRRCGHSRAAAARGGESANKNRCRSEDHTIAAIRGSMRMRVLVRRSRISTWEAASACGSSRPQPTRRPREDDVDHSPTAANVASVGVDVCVRSTKATLRRLRFDATSMAPTRPVSAETAARSPNDRETWPPGGLRACRGSSGRAR